MESKEKFRYGPGLRLTDQVRQVLRYHHYAYSTEHICCDWILRFIKFHGSQTHPKEMGKNEIDSSLSDLATHGTEICTPAMRKDLTAGRAQPQV